MKDIKDQIIEKQDELIKVYTDYVIGNETEGYSWENDFQIPANKLIKEISDLKAKLEKESGLKCNINCKWFAIGYGHCVWCIRNSPYTKDDKSYHDNFELMELEHDKNESSKDDTYRGRDINNFPFEHEI